MAEGSMVLPVRPSARALAIASLLLWGASLLMLGFSTLRGDIWQGYEILAAGWLELLDAGFAWLANPFLLWAGFALLKGWRAGLSAPAAALSACDLLRLHEITVSENNTTSPINAFGFGAVVWAVSIAVMLAAAGTRAMELRAAGTPGPKSGLVVWLRPLGFVLASLILVAVAVVHQEQLKQSNAATRLELNAVAFKLGPVCNAPDPSVAEPMQALEGPLELKYHTGNIRSFFGYAELLAWGVHVVRVGGYDYSLLKSSEASIVTSRPASGGVAAIVDLWDDERDGHIAYRATLTDAASRRQVFDQTWIQAGPDAEMCPRFISSSPQAGDQPRKLLLQGLSIGPNADGELLNFNHYWAVIGQPLEAEVLDRGSGADKRRQGNNCSADAGLMDQAVAARLHLPFDAHDGWFHIGEVIYESTADTFNVRCEGDRVYIYRAWADTDPAKETRVRIEARSLQDFRLVWAGMFPVTEVQGLDSAQSIQIRSVNQTDSGTIIDLANLESGHWVKVNLPTVR